MSYMVRVESGPFCVRLPDTDGKIIEFQFISIISLSLGAYHSDGSQLLNKQDILDAIVACRRAHTKEDYLKCRADLMILTEHLNVRPGRVKNAVTFSQYFLTNWDTVQPMWVYAYRKELPLQVKHFQDYWWVDTTHVSFKML